MDNTKKPTPEEFAAALEKLSGSIKRMLPLERAEEFLRIVSQHDTLTVQLAEHIVEIEDGLKLIAEIHGPDVAAEAWRRVWQNYRRIGGDQTSLAE